MLNIGKLRKRLTLQTRSLAPDETGQQIESYPDLATVWGSVAFRQGSEQPGPHATVAVQRVEFTIRTRTGLSETARVLYKGRAYDIDTVAELGEDGLKLTAYTRDDNALPG